jgi:DNA polymerase III subunit epsilon
VADAGLTAADRYRQRFVTTWDDRTPVDQVRFVVLDSETTGLDPRTDRIVTLGAVAVQGDEIVLSDAFDALVKVEENTSAVTVHGVTRDESRRGRGEAEVLSKFLEYLGDGVIVGHHIGHDISTLNAAYERGCGLTLLNRSADTMDLTLHLERDGAFADRPPIRHFTLDALCDMFGVIPHDRHTASGDAFLTAQVFQRLLRLAAKRGRTTLARITEEYTEPAV